MMLKNALLGVALLALAAGTSGVPARAASSLADIQKAVDESSSELDQVDALLADPDANKRLTAIKALLASGNPVWVKRAKEVGLFSSDPELQQAVVTAILDSGGPFRMDITLADEDKTGIRNWLNYVKGDFDDENGIGHYTFRIQQFDSKEMCWKFVDQQARQSGNCAFTPTGNNYSMNGGYYTSGNVSLNAEGALVGKLRFTNGNYSAVAISIPLAE